MRPVPSLNGFVTVLFVVIGLTSLVVVINALFPNFITRTRQNVERMPIRSFLIGLINFVFFGLIAFALFIFGRNLRSFGAVFGTVLYGFGGVVMALLLAMVTLGIAAVARLVGERLMPSETASPKQWLGGAIALELGALTPFVGWFFVPLLAGLSGLGATIIALIWRK